jgi:hypothetical protein
LIAAWIFLCFVMMIRAQILERLDQQASGVSATSDTGFRRINSFKPGPIPLVTEEGD